MKTSVASTGRVSLTRAPKNFFTGAGDAGFFSKLLAAAHAHFLSSITESTIFTPQILRMKTIFVTGGTGFLGSHFINAIAEKYPTWSMLALVRGKSTAEAAARLAASQRLAHVHSGGSADTVATRSQVVLGDIQAELCGVQSGSIAELSARNIEEFWHFASSLNFEEERRDYIRAHNINGAMHAVRLALAMRCKRFIYISTAYTSGTLQGSVPERIHDDIGFHNYYEETKNEAEKLIQSLCREHDMELVILRPSIVIGPMSSKKPGGSVTGLYGFLRAIAKVRRFIGTHGKTLRVYGDPEVGLNLIPVDHVIADICFLIDQGLRDGDIRHLTSDCMPTVGQCGQAISEAMGIPGFSIEKFDRSTANFIEKAAEAKTVFYTSYINSRKEFQRSIPTVWNVTPTDVREFVREYLAEEQRQRAVA